VFNQLNKKGPIVKNTEYESTKQIRKQLTYTDANAVTTIAQLPVGTDVAVHVQVDEVFDNTNTIKVGTGVNDNKFTNAYNISTAGSSASVTRFTTTETERDIVATISNAATAGAVTIRLEYFLPTSQEVSY